MATLPTGLKKRIADLYLKNRTGLDELDPNALESFAQ